MTVDDMVQRILKSSDADSFNQLPTGVRGLDEVLGGGVPEYSFNLNAGAPGTVSHGALVRWAGSWGVANEQAERVGGQPPGREGE